VKTVRCLSILTLICLFSAVAFGQSVNTDYDHSANFSNYRTYAWGASPHPINDSLWNQRIIETIDGALAGKGLQKVNLDQNPDLIVVYNAGVKENVSYQGYAMGGWWNRTASIQQVVEKEGTLVVDFADPHTKMIVWRGVAGDTLSNKSNKNIQKLQKMVAKMFQKYPPSAN